MEFEMQFCPKPSRKVIMHIRAHTSNKYALTRTRSLAIVAEKSTPQTLNIYVYIRLPRIPEKLP